MTEFGISSDGPRMYFLSGELDMATVPIMDAALGTAVARGGPITLDVTDMTFIDSTGVGAILRSAKDLPTGCITLHGVKDGIGRVMDLMGVEHAPRFHVLPCVLGGRPEADLAPTS